MPESMSAQPKSDMDAGHIGDNADPPGRRSGILFLLILAGVTVIGFAGFLYRIFSAGG